MRKLSYFLILAIVSSLAASARADEPAAPPPNAVAPPHVEAVKPAVLPAHPVVLYIQDWSHLAEVTRTDAQVFARADYLAMRSEASRQVTIVGWLLGGSVALAGTISRLSTDHWTDFTKWSVGGGLGLVALTSAISWLVEPNHSDLAAVVNDWNQRHPDRPLAP